MFFRLVVPSDDAEKCRVSIPGMIEGIGKGMSRSTQFW